MFRIDSQHWKISTSRHFQNGRHNTANIQHCPISSKFDMRVDNDVPNWFPTLKNFYRSPLPQYRTNSTLSDFNAISYVGRLWCPELIPDIEIFYRSPFSQYRTNSTLSDFNNISYVGRLWCSEMIPDIEKFLPVSIFKMATTITHKFNIVRFQRPELIPDIEKLLPVSIFKMATTIPQKFNIVRFQR
jgi:hypothetical protein